ncbi:trehalase family glycosidase [Asaia prunellae]|uniref:trehalase family glycosidase n=1 Tax=Asaia prunellae TaxID=610245 RepID=UPI000687BF8B
MTSQRLSFSHLLLLGTSLVVLNVSAMSTGARAADQRQDVAQKAPEPAITSSSVPAAADTPPHPSTGPRETVASEAAHSLHVASVPQDLRSPSIALGGLFAAIGGAHLAPDFKTIADSRPNEAPAQLLQSWEEQRKNPDFSLKAFYTAHFTPPQRHEITYQRKADENIYDYIQGMWSVLTRQPDKPMAYSSLLPLPHAYVVPGGRFSELYYWDTYFTMIGLYETGTMGSATRHDPGHGLTC